jgi:transcriptional regulator with XRE-family HTH domain
VLADLRAEQRAQLLSNLAGCFSATVGSELRRRVIMPESLGKKLAAARTDRNWSLREVERRTGIHNAHLSQIETGAIERPAPNVLWALAEVYELDLGELMRLSGHVEAAKGTPGSLVGAALRALGEMSPPEQEQVLQFMEDLQKGKGARQQSRG